ncbi:unnamed protein product [Closterium sp. Naga37s-1]|nr:unnamed protein product [Closterium sp. Naga37s-1]
MAYPVARPVARLVSASLPQPVAHALPAASARRRRATRNCIPPPERYPLLQPVAHPVALPPVARSPPLVRSPLLVASNCRFVPYPHCPCPSPSLPRRAFPLYRACLCRVGRWWVWSAMGAAAAGMAGVAGVAGLAAHVGGWGRRGGKGCARAAPFCSCYLVLLFCPRVPVLPPCSHAAPVLPRSALALPRSACAAPLSPCCPVLPVLPRSARVLPRSGRVLPRSARVASFSPCPAPFCPCWPVLPVLPRSARLCPTRAVRTRWCPTRAVSSRSCPTRSVLPGLVLPVTPVGAAARHAAGQAPSRGARGTHQCPIGAAPTGQCQPLSGCQQPTAPVKTQAEPGPSKYPAQATTPLVGQEHHPEGQEKESGDGTEAPVATPVEGEDAADAVPGPQHRPGGRPGRKERREGPSTGQTGTAEEEAPAVLARQEQAEVEEALPPRGPAAPEEQRRLERMTPGAAVAPEGTPKSADFEAEVPNLDPKKPTAPSTGRATGAPMQTRAAAARKMPASTTDGMAEEEGEAAPEGAMDADAAPGSREAAGQPSENARTAVQATGTAGEDADGGTTGPGPVDEDASAHEETDKSAHEARSKQQAPGKNRHRPRQQQHQRRLGAGLAPARPGPLVGWAEQEDDPRAADAEVQAGADPSSPHRREIAAEAPNERESAAEEEEDRRAAARHSRHQGETRRQ